jgi:hypothetical protein
VQRFLPRLTLRSVMILVALTAGCLATTRWIEQAIDQSAIAALTTEEPEYHLLYQQAAQGKGAGQAGKYDQHAKMSRDARLARERDSPPIVRSRFRFRLNYSQLFTSGR